MPIVLVERALPAGVELTPESIEKSRRCYEARRIEHLHSYVSADGRRMTCVYRAPDAASVREANDLSKQPYEAVWSAKVFGPDGRERAE